MQNTADKAEDGVPENERELLALASRDVANVQAAMDSIELFLEGSSKVISAAEKVSGIFATVAGRLGDATFKATFAATEGKAPREIAVALVTELSELASMSLKGSNELRRELRDATSMATTALPSLRQARTAMQSLSGVLKALAARPNRTAVQPPVVVELRPVVMAVSATRSKDTRPQRDDAGPDTTTAQPGTRRLPN